MRDEHQAERGFTLLETLVALTVLGLLVVGLSQGVRTGLGFWNVQTRRTVETAELDSVARVLRSVLTTIPIQPAALGAPVAIEFRGQSDRVILIGQLPTGLGAIRRAEMTIHLQAGRIVITWAPHWHDPPQAAAPVPTVTELMRGIDHLEFAYWGRAAGNLPASWSTRWDGPALPGLIRLRLSFRKGDNRRWPDLVAAPLLWNSDN